VHFLSAVRGAELLATMPARRGSDVRGRTGAVVLSAAGAALCWSSSSSGFTAPLTTQRLQTTETTSAAQRTNIATAGASRFTGQAAHGAQSDAHAFTESPRLTDGVSMTVAAAGAATAMKAMSVARQARGGEEAAEQSFFEKNKVYVYIGLWYFFNIGYNIYNKKALIAFPYPWACALWQMFFGIPVFGAMWLFGIRKAPKMNTQQMIKLSPAAFGHLATHVGAVIAFFAGAVSFGHIVKASEPVVSCALNAVFLGEVLPWQVYASLLPIIGGVGLASAAEMSFNWLCFGAAMGSNVGSAARGVYSKMVMSRGGIGENMNASNIYAVLTIMAFVLLVPIAFLMESPATMIAGFKASYAVGGSKFVMSMLYSGLYYYLYNEVAFLALGQLDPVSHAVSNTMKRVVIIIASIIVFRTPVTTLGVIGSSIAILGTLGYSIAKNTFSK